MTKFFVSGESADGAVVPVAAGSDGDDAAPAFAKAVESGKYVRVELFRYPAASKRWTLGNAEAVAARSVKAAAKKKVAVAAGVDAGE